MNEANLIAWYHQHSLRRFFPFLHSFIPHSLAHSLSFSLCIFLSTGSHPPSTIPCSAEEKCYWNSNKYSCPRLISSHLMIAASSSMSGVSCLLNDWEILVQLVAHSSWSPRSNKCFSRIHLLKEGSHRHPLGNSLSHSNQNGPTLSQREDHLFITGSFFFFFLLLIFVFPLLFSSPLIWQGESWKKKV